MQYLQDIMTNYLPKSFTSHHSTKLTKNTQEKNVMDSGCGDFDYDSMSLISTTADSLTSISKYTSIPPERCLRKQEQNTKTLVRSLEHEIAESKEDIRYLNNHIYNAEEYLPKRWEICQYLKNLCKEQMDTLSMEMMKWKRKSERFDLEMKELEQRIGSWQCIIDKAKEVQIQEVDFFD